MLPGRRRLAFEHLAQRYGRQGLVVTWDASLIDWLATQQDASASLALWERLVDEQLSPLLVRHLPRPGEPEVALSVHYDGGVRVVPRG